MKFMKWHNLASWFSDKITTESKICKDLRHQIEELGFEPHTASIIVALKTSDGDNNYIIKFRFRPEVIEETIIPIE